MCDSIREYFDDTIVPAITEKFPEVAAQMSVIVLGSQGLGTADEFSDLEAAVYLHDPIWREYGGHLQLLLNERLRATCPCRSDGSVISACPHSWLLDGHAHEFIGGKAPLPWEQVFIEDLFTVQENLIVYDSNGFLLQLRQATAPEQYPRWLWQKRLILALKKLVYEDATELDMAVRRNRRTEAHILLGEVLRDLLHIGFLMNRRYYPWRTHLRWAFDRLPESATNVIGYLDAAVTASDWQEKLRAVDQAIATYKENIARERIMPQIDIMSSDLSEELVWAERLKAWENPNWRDWITRCTERATKAGHPARDFWVWSLWGWE